MVEELHVADDQSHYEISLTAGQAFMAFVLLLLSLAASFAFGLMIGKGQVDERLVVQKETPVVTEASLTPKKQQGRIVELGVADDDFQQAEPSEAAAAEASGTPDADSSGATAAPAAEDSTTAIVEAIASPAAPEPSAASPGAGAAPAVGTSAATAPTPSSAPRLTTYAQLLSTENQKTAETLAARVIDAGFTTAYVERGSTDKGPVYRVRVKFDSEAAARAAEPRLREFSKEVWITTR